MKLFNRDGNGADELVAIIGLIGNGISYNVWEPILPLGIRDVKAIIGSEPVEKLAEFYENGEIPDDSDFPATCTIPLFYLQQAVAYFTWLKIIPTLDAGHDVNGRSKRLGENEKGMTALQEFKDEENIKRLAYEAVDALVEALDRGCFEWWTKSERFQLREGLLVRNKETFDMYYHTGSHRLFITLLPIMREVQSTDVAPVLGSEYLNKLLVNDEQIKQKLYDHAARALVLLTMKKAIERLPVEVIPEGIVQVQQSQPIKQRLKAEKEARQAVATSLGEDANRQLEILASLVNEMDGGGVDGTILGPIVHSKGLTY